MRSYNECPIEKEKVHKLSGIIGKINDGTGLHFQLILNDPRAFSGIAAKLGTFGGVKNYFVLAGAPGRDEDVGYYGEVLVIASQMMGLGTCWVRSTYNKSKAVFDLRDGEEVYLVISVGYGKNCGKPHVSRDVHEIADGYDGAPDWYRRGIDSVMLAPTAINQQKFHFSLDGDAVKAEAGVGRFPELDLGIAKFHFDAAAGRDCFGYGDFSGLFAEI